MFRLDADWSRSTGSGPPGRPRGGLTQVLEDRSRFTEVGGYLVGRVAPGELADIAAEWTALCGRADGADVAAMPDYVLPALTHLRRGAVPSFIAIWRPAGAIGTSRLVGLAAVLRKARLFAPPSVRFWTPPFSDAAVVLLDRDERDGAAAALLSWMAQGAGTPLGLEVVEDARGPAWAAAVMAATRGLGLAVETRDAPAPARRKAANDRGATAPVEPLRVSLAKSHDDVAAAVEELIALDIASGAGGIVADEPTANFIRVVARGLAHRDACRVATVIADETAVARALILGGRGRRRLWMVAGLPGWREAAAGLLRTRLKLAEEEPEPAPTPVMMRILLAPAQAGGRPHAAPSPRERLAGRGRQPIRLPAATGRETSSAGKRS